MDIRCAKCGEPWDSYGVNEGLHHREGDMTYDEARKFTAGKGCPACGFGLTCTHCYGTGKEPDGSYSKCGCFGHRARTVRLVQKGGRCWPHNPEHSLLVPRRDMLDLYGGKKPIPAYFEIHSGYLPNVHILTEDERAKALPVPIPSNVLLNGVRRCDADIKPCECRDGWYLEIRVRCWMCYADAPACEVCKGTGKFVQRGESRTPEFQAVREVLGGDTDGMLATLEDLS